MGFLFVGWWLDLFMPQIGKVLIISGIVMLTVGCFLVFFSDKIKWFGNLPLDFSYKNDSTRFYAPNQPIFGKMDTNMMDTNKVYSS